VRQRPPAGGSRPGINLQHGAFDMAKVVTFKMKKHYGNNVIGDVATFSESTAAHIKKHDGGVVLAEWDDSTHSFDVASGKAVTRKSAEKV
jgi:hypothetical protein